jgi:hypothetical protein
MKQTTSLQLLVTQLVKNFNNFYVSRATQGVITLFKTTYHGP